MNEKQIKAARAMRDQGMSDQEIAETLGVEAQLLRAVLRGTPVVVTEPKPPPAQKAVPLGGGGRATVHGGVAVTIDVPDRRNAAGMGASGGRPLTADQQVEQLRFEHAGQASPSVPKRYV